MKDLYDLRNPEDCDQLLIDLFISGYKCNDCDEYVDYKNSLSFCKDCLTIDEARQLINEE
jgi:hypothetical protein